MLLLLLGILAILILLFLPLDLFRRPAPLPIPDSRVDERDTMFARIGREAGTPQYEEYYSRRPELKQGDDHLRAMIPLMKPGAREYDPKISRQAELYFEEIFDIEADPATVDKWRVRFEDSPDKNQTIREMVLALGAVAVGCTSLREEYIYTHKGRFAEDYGHQIRLDNPSVIIFLVEMDFDEMKRAPRAEAIRESARQYWRAAVVARNLEAVLKAAGYAAKAHYDAHYDLILPPLAVEAGLGEVGRNNFLIANRFGSRVRIAAVTTDLLLGQDVPIYLGVDHFCSICRKCADNCPSRALSLIGREEVRGVRKWPTETEKCYAYWRQVGTDCGICMAVCPFSHRNTLFHNLVRCAVRLNPWLRHIARFFDDLIYSHQWKPKRTT